MKMPLLSITVVLMLAGCASTTPAPVADARAPSRVEETRTQGKSAPTKKSQPPVPAGQAEVKPIASDGPVASRALDERPLAKPAVPPAPTFSSPVQARPPATDNDALKREPKGGKLPYSEENLARLRAQETPPSPAQPSSPPAAAAAPTAEIEWAWPAAGKLLSVFTEGMTGQEANKGIDLAGKIGDPVQAAAAGKIIYVGAMAKYGNLVIVLHAGGHSSVYAHTSKTLVKEGQMVTRGQKIAELGDSDADQPKLHFEIRQQGRPVDPMKFLPPR